MRLSRYRNKNIEVYTYKSNKNKQKTTKPDDLHNGCKKKFESLKQINMYKHLNLDLAICIKIYDDDDDDVLRLATRSDFHPYCVIFFDCRHIATRLH